MHKCRSRSLCDVVVLVHSQSYMMIFGMCKLPLNREKNPKGFKHNKPGTESPTQHYVVWNQSVHGIPFRQVQI